MNFGLPPIRTYTADFKKDFHYQMSPITLISAFNDHTGDGQSESYRKRAHKTYSFTNVSKYNKLLENIREATSHKEAL